MRDESERETRTVEVELDERTARRLKQLAWEYEKTPNDVATQCCRYGVREYEGALGLD